MNLPVSSQLFTPKVSINFGSILNLLFLYIVSNEVSSFADNFLDLCFYDCLSLKGYLFLLELHLLYDESAGQD